MTTGNKTDKNVTIKRIILISVCAILAIALCVGAYFLTRRDTDDSYDDIFGDLPDAPETVREYDMFALVVPSQSSAQLYERVRSFGDAIAEQTKTEARMLYDYETLPEVEKLCVILIGSTSYVESKSFSRTFAIGDYAYGKVGDYIVMAGGSEASTLLAIEAFCTRALPYSSPELFVATGFDHAYTDGDISQRHRINGFAVYDYVIVYPRANGVLFELATSLADKIAQKTGFLLDVCADDTQDARVRAISLGRNLTNGDAAATLAENECALLEYPTGVAILAESDYGIGYACERLVASLESSRDVSLRGKTSCFFSRAELSFADLEFFNSKMTMLEAIEVTEYIKNSNFSAVRISGLEKKYVYQNIAFGLDGFYTLIDCFDNGYLLISDRVLASSGEGSFTEGSVKMNEARFELLGLGAQISFSELVIADGATKQEIESLAEKLRERERAVIFTDGSAENIAILVNSAGNMNLTAGICYSAGGVQSISVQKTEGTLFAQELYELCVFGK